jgi:hypothetical protein
MREIEGRQRNWAPWLCFLFTVIAIALNAWTFMSLRGTQVIVGLSFLAGICALVYGIIGVRRAFGHPQMFAGKTSSSMFGVLALLICGLMAFAWFSSRALPAAAGAPRVGQKAPDFTMLDTQGNKVSLAQLLGKGDSSGAAKTGGAAPKAVLLIFYRGNW